MTSDLYGWWENISNLKYQNEVVQSADYDEILYCLSLNIVCTARC